jgi:phenol 2-monooxygenase
MPVYTETAHSARDLRILPSRAPPLPRISLRQDGLQNSERGSIEKHEVVVIGVSTLSGSIFRSQRGDLDR